MVAEILNLFQLPVLPILLIWLGRTNIFQFNNHLSINGSEFIVSGA